MYGSLVIEDISDYNVIVRMLTEAAGTNTGGVVDQTAVSEGIGGFKNTSWNWNDAAKVNKSSGSLAMGPQNVRLLDIQSGSFDSGGMNELPHTAVNSTKDNVVYRRYQVQVALGFFQQGKLIPLKWMASQLTLEIELASFAQACAADVNGGTPTNIQNAAFQLDNITFNAQLLEFDGSYDAAFLEGLRGEGVPIKFASWDRFYHTPSPSTSQTIMIPERNRSLKAIFAVMLPPPQVAYRSTGSGVDVTALPAVGAGPQTQSDGSTIEANADGTYTVTSVDGETETITKNEKKGMRSMYGVDSHAFLQSSAGLDNACLGPSDEPFGTYTGWCKSFQFRIGGKYYPAQPVDCGQIASNGAAEAYTEFAKALNIVGDYRLSTAITPNRWCMTNNNGDRRHTVSSFWDYPGVCRFGGENNNDVENRVISRFHDGPSCFVIAADLETSNGGEISGMNGEEQNDISLNIQYSDPQDPQCQMLIFVYYDVLMILRENNLVELIK